MSDQTREEYKKSHSSIYYKTHTHTQVFSFSFYLVATAEEGHGYRLCSAQLQAGRKLNPNIHFSFSFFSFLLLFFPTPRLLPPHPAYLERTGRGRVPSCAVRVALLCLSSFSLSSSLLPGLKGKKNKGTGGRPSIAALLPGQGINTSSFSSSSSSRKKHIHNI